MDSVALYEAFLWGEITEQELNEGLDALCLTGWMELASAKGFYKQWEPGDDETEE